MLSFFLKLPSRASTLELCFIEPLGPLETKDGERERGGGLKPTSKLSSNDKCWGIKLFEIGFNKSGGSK